MSGSGTPDLAIEGASGLRVAVVAALWHAQVMDGLLAGAQRALHEAAVAEVKPKLPWIGTPDELAVWATALGLRKEIDDLFKRSLDDSGRSSSGWSPAWYVGGVGSMASFGSVIGSISTTSASSSGSGYGGGSSGGGGGASGGF